MRIDLDRPELTDVVADATLTGAQLLIRYRSPARDEATERLVVPRQVFADRGEWYMSADDDRSVEERSQVRLTSATLPASAACLGETLGDQALHAMGVAVVSLRSADGAVSGPDDNRVLQAGDTLVLSGTPEPLALAEAKLLKG